MSGARRSLQQREAASKVSLRTAERRDVFSRMTLRAAPIFDRRIAAGGLRRSGGSEGDRGPLALKPMAGEKTPLEQGRLERPPFLLMLPWLVEASSCGRGADSLPPGGLRVWRGSVSDRGPPGGGRVGNAKRAAFPSRLLRAPWISLLRLSRPGHRFGPEALDLFMPKPERFLPLGPKLPEVIGPLQVLFAVVHRGFGDFLPHA